MHHLQEQQIRQQALQFAIDNNRLEGLYLPPEILHYFQKWVIGEITIAELKVKTNEVS
ncbi:antitoxin VbhA family protein [Avibacterium sp. 20-129]|uniref:antitoxin VbhA family protein n=1 Tax=Avibacterium sp. 20-129 TaxID=2911525 RepID=UPI002246102F|nr:antitoxin VbhA family protein [Avibacterium sp. 20-129]MCW9697966.1 antitoxin VbhA family protein [Avibacterium sp. 20-129]